VEAAAVVADSTGAAWFPRVYTAESRVQTMMLPVARAPRLLLPPDEVLSMLTFYKGKMCYTETMGSAENIFEKMQELLATHGNPSAAGAKVIVPWTATSTAADPRDQPFPRRRVRVHVSKRPGTAELLSAVQRRLRQETRAKAEEDEGRFDHSEKAQSSALGHQPAGAAQIAHAHPREAQAAPQAAALPQQAAVWDLQALAAAVEEAMDQPDQSGFFVV
jgi:hypothetical protein